MLKRWLVLYLLILSILVFFLVVEQWFYRRHIRSIPIRIHVNGTRGKSAVVRLIASALRKGGAKVLAKTTGTVPTLIYPDGQEEIMIRRGPARIQEQADFIRKASKMGVNAVVVECMALDPALQAFSEDRLIQSTVGVITNVRRDHFETMGKDLDEIAHSLSQTIPKASALITADRRFFRFFQSRASQKQTKVLKAGGRDKPEQLLTLESISEENAEIARTVCSVLPITASEKHVEPESLPSMTYRYEAEGKTIFFVDAFSANDIDSTKLIQQATLSSKGLSRPHIALLNNRSDRPLRMQSFASFLTENPLYDLIVLAGDLRFMAKRLLSKRVPESKILSLKNQNPEEALKVIRAGVSSSVFTLFGMGNYKGIGENLSHFFRKRGEPWDLQSRSRSGSG